MRLLVSLAVLGVGATAWLATATAGSPQELLPDLDQRAPYGLIVETAGSKNAPHFRLAFASAVDNIGEGPLIVDGRRPTRKTPEMTASQVIEVSDGSTSLRDSVGIIRYVSSPDHAHWHFLSFDRYELRRAGDFELLVRDRKTGFCLGDRYPTGAGPEQESVFTTRCGLNGSELLGLREGITSGFGDDYKPSLEGQYLDVTDLDPGRYVLVHRVNEKHALLESDYTNNAASLLLRLSWPRGRDMPPDIDVLGACPDSERCPRTA